VCEDPQCQLRARNPPFLVAAATLKHGLQAQQGASLDFQFSQLAEFVKRTGTKPGCNDKTVRMAYDRVTRLVNGVTTWARGIAGVERAITLLLPPEHPAFDKSCYPCQKAESRLELALNTSDEDLEEIIRKYTSLLSLYRENILPEPPYMVHARANELIVGWCKQGMRALQPNTVAACAFAIACYDVRTKIQGGVCGGEEDGDWVSKQFGKTEEDCDWMDFDKLCKVAAIEKGTLKDGLKEMLGMQPVKSDTYPEMNR